MELRYFAACPSAGLSDRLVAIARRLEQRMPRHHIWAAAKQSSSLTFGHTTPDTELNAIIKRISQTFGTYRASETNSLCAILCSPLDEQFVRFCFLARCECRPVLRPCHCLDHPRDLGSHQPLLSEYPMTSDAMQTVQLRSSGQRYEKKCPFGLLNVDHGRDSA